MVTPLRAAKVIHSSGRRMKSSVGMTFSCMRCANIMMCMPMRPMSWVSGIQVRLVSFSFHSEASPAPRALVRMFLWVSTMPLGSLVDPEENWMNAVSSGFTSCVLPAFEMSLTFSAKKAREARLSKVACSPAPPAKAPMRSSVFLSV